MSIKNYWNRLNPKHKRIIAIGGGILVIFALVHTFGQKPKESSLRGAGREDAIRNVLTDRNTRDISIDSLSANMQIVQRETDALKKEIERLNKELERAAAQGTTVLGLDQQVEQLRREMSGIRDGIELQAATAQSAANREDDGVGDDDQAEHTADAGAVTAPIQPVQPASLAEQYKTAGEVFERSPAPPAIIQNPETGERIPLKIVSHYQPVSKKAAEVEKDEAVYMPSGSILTGVLINGIDAPTGQGARRDPFPVTLRLQKEAILPNHFQADVRECFMIVSGYGDLSSERAYLRGETISCIREDGGVIEAKLNSYVVGEDGKAGVRGRLVSKQGQVIAKSLMAGFMGGMANAFDVNPVPVLSTSPTGQTQYQDTFSNSMVQGAAMKGASTALDRVAQFYIEMAESMFPVIEIDAGREVDVIITGGVSLKILNKR